MNKSFYTVKWKWDSVSFIDQRVLPLKEFYIECETPLEVANAIETMVVRGAPAIGIAGAFGLALGLNKNRSKSVSELKIYFDELCVLIAKTRPTAVNLFWAINRVKEKFYKLVNSAHTTDELVDTVIEEALKIYEEDLDINHRIGLHGAALIKGGMNILTHCNAGALATAGYGTALSVIRSANESGKKIHVYADETRPFLQGARLTMWELMKDGIDCTLVTDNMSGYLMANRKVDFIVVGADRVAVNGDAANKIGTYSLAVLAKYHSIPMYFAVPISTMDINCSDGSKIPIEQRSIDEVRRINGSFICPEASKAFNPSFDVTPNELITGIITEKGVLYPPFKDKIIKIVQGGEL